ncbi:RNA methyltransferase [Leucobacter sp. cx-42]|uniref:TrmH family RNA methyltransferase n=1 Tax=unclassified Leucobacter TaxID=2621730 RepID=UPI00165E4EA1|nr:RNA methyltransferase [Leucobacter sp. cx-42]
MNDAILENPKATRVKRAAALARKKERREQQRFLVEGPQAVRELLVHRPELAEVVYATIGNEPWQREMDQLANDAGIRIERATPEVLATLAETVQPQGVIAVARLENASVETMLESARLIAVLHEVRDPGNAGAVLRAADAAGADGVIFTGDAVDPWHPKVVRSTTGSIFHLPVAVVPELGDAVQSARSAGLEIIAADVRGMDLSQARAHGDLNGSIAWVFGNEARGLTEEERETIGRALKLPIYGAAESLNLATAASVLLYETAFAQRG